MSTETRMTATSILDEYIISPETLPEVRGVLFMERSQESASLLGLSHTELVARVASHFVQRVDACEREKNCSELRLGRRPAMYVMSFLIERQLGLAKDKEKLVQSCISCARNEVNPYIRESFQCSWEQGRDLRRAILQLAPSFRGDHARYHLLMSGCHKMMSLYDDWKPGDEMILEPIEQTSWTWTAQYSRSKEIGRARDWWRSYGLSVARDRLVEYTYKMAGL